MLEDVRFFFSGSVRLMSFPDLVGKFALSLRYSTYASEHRNFYSKPHKGHSPHWRQPIAGIENCPGRTMTIVRHLLKSMFHVPSLNLTTWKFDIDASSASFDGLEAIVGSWKRTPCSQLSTTRSSKYTRMQLKQSDEDCSCWISYAM